MSVIRDAVEVLQRTNNNRDAKSVEDLRTTVVSLLTLTQQLEDERIWSLREALRDLIEAVDAVCNSDAFGDEPTLEPHARSVLELALQRARAAAGGAEGDTDAA